MQTKGKNALLMARVGSALPGNGRDLLKDGGIFDLAVAREAGAHRYRGRRGLGMDPPRKG